MPIFTGVTSFSTQPVINSNILANTDNSSSIPTTSWSNNYWSYVKSVDNAWTGTQNFSVANVSTLNASTLSVNVINASSATSSMNIGGNLTTGSITIGTATTTNTILGTTNVSTLNVSTLLVDTSATFLGIKTNSITNSYGSLGTIYDGLAQAKVAPNAIIASFGEYASSVAIGSGATASVSLGFAMTGSSLNIANSATQTTNILIGNGNAAVTGSNKIVIGKSGKTNTISGTTTLDNGTLTLSNSTINVNTALTPGYTYPVVSTQIGYNITYDLSATQLTLSVTNMAWTSVCYADVPIGVWLLHGCCNTSVANTFLLTIGISSSLNGGINFNAVSSLGSSVGTIGVLSSRVVVNSTATRWYLNCYSSLPQTLYNNPLPAITMTRIA